MVGMAIAVVVTLALVYSTTKNVALILAGIAVGGVDRRGRSRGACR